MKLLRLRWLALLVMSFTTLLVMSGCGGGGGDGGSTPAAKASISGAVTFPTISITPLVQKRAGSQVPSPDVTIEAYTIDGVKVASVTPSYDDTKSQRIYAYSFKNLEKGKDYVIKAKKLNVALKKLIEKKDVSGDMVAQELNAVSTAAVIVASKKLDVSLGDTLPQGKSADAVSTSISTGIKPALLETEINALVEGQKSAVTTDPQAALANVYNIVVSAAVENVDPAAMFTAASPTLTNTVPILTVTSGVASVTQTKIDPTVATGVLTGAASGYSPPTPTEAAAKYNTLAKNYLTAQDISNASLNYEKALSIDPNNTEANFGGAITSGMMIIEDTDVQTVITKWGAVVPTVNQVVQGTSPIKLPFGNVTSIKLVPKTVAKSVAKSTSATQTQKVLAAFSTLKASLPQQKAGFKSLAKELKLVPTTAPSVSEMQTLITNVIIPKVDKILARLAKAEGKNFSFTVTKAMQGNPVNGSDISLSDGEFYTLDAALNIFQIIFKIASAYNFDVPAGYTYDTIAQDPLAMINSPSFFTLKSDGIAKMSSALGNARNGAAKAKLAYDTILLRSVLTGTAPALDITSWTAQDMTDFTTGLASVTAALNGPYIYSYTDSGVAKSLKIDATKFFTNPLTKANLPKFTYDVPRDATLSTKYHQPVAGEHTIQRMIGVDQFSNPIFQSVIEPIDCNIVPASDLPNYTLNGILPDNSPTNNIAEFTGILPALDGKIVKMSDGSEVFSKLSLPMAYDGSKIFFYASSTTNQSAYVLDPLTGIMSLYFSSVQGVPTGWTYNGLRWYADGIYALIRQQTATGVQYEYRPITVASSTCTIGTTTKKQVIIPSGRTSFSVDQAGVVYFVNVIPQTTTTAYSFTLYSATELTAPLITLDNTKRILNFRNGIISVVDSSSGDLIEQYQINSAGTAATLIGSYFNVGQDPYDHVYLTAGGGYYWQFDGVKMIKYAGKPDGSKF